MKKILLINPWGINNDEFYTSGLTNALNKVIQLDLATNFYYEGSSPNGNLYKVFFRRTEKNKKNGIYRKTTRGIEYVTAYFKLLRIIKKNRYDYIHIQWLLMYKFDYILLKKIKGMNTQIILTAHNALPHVNADKYIGELRKIYTTVDKILVHGEAIKQELLITFPELKEKVFIQPHGAVLHRKELQPNYQIEKSLMEMVDNKELYIMFGNQFYNKGTDRLLKIWRKNYLSDSKRMLIVAGRKTNVYPELEHEMEHLKDDSNVVFLNGYIDEELLEYLILHSEAILLPYRHASMSGVVFTAAEYQTMILTTRCGAIPEYLAEGQDSIVVGNTDEDFAAGLKKLMAMSKEERASYGRQLYANINMKYSWESIVQLLMDSVYK